MSKDTSKKPVKKTGKKPPKLFTSMNWASIMMHTSQAKAVGESCDSVSRNQS